MVHKTFLSRALLTGAVAGGLLLMAGGAVPARADRRDDDECRNRVARAQADVDRDAARRGEHSRQVADDLKRLDAARSWCGKRHADWNHDRDKDYDRYRDGQRRDEEHHDNDRR